MSLPSTDIKSVAETIKEKLQAQAAGLIPDEVYAQIVNAGVDSLIEKQHYKVHPITGNQGSYSKLELMIFEEISNQAKKQIKTYFDENNLGLLLTSQGSSELPSIIKETLAEHSGKILQSVMTNVIGNAMMDILVGVRNNLSSQGIHMR